MTFVAQRTHACRVETRLDALALALYVTRNATIGSIREALRAGR